MSKSNTWENAILELLFNATGFANIADNAGTGPLSNLYVSLHTSSPGEAGNQESNEATYTDYARVAVARTSGGWDVSGNSVSPVADIVFPQASGGSETITHAGIGTDSTGTGRLLYYGAVSPNIAVAVGVTPRLTTATAITEE